MQIVQRDFLRRQEAEEYLDAPRDRRIARGPSVFHAGSSRLAPFRLNEGNVQRHTLERLDSFVSGVVGKRLTYKQLIH